MVDGNLVRKIEDLPPALIPYVRERIHSTGAHMMMANLGFSPVFALVTATGTGTQVIPSGATQVEIQGWGPGGGGAAVFIVGTLGGGGGGGGAFARCKLSVAASNGQVFKHVVGTGSPKLASSGDPSNFAGTTQITGTAVTGFTAITLQGATSGFNGGGGLGGTFTNANGGGTNIAGNGGTGAPGGGVAGGAGGAGIVGNNGSDGSPYGTGGKGALGNVDGQDGAVSYLFT